MSIPENYVGKPQPGMPFSQRVQELDTMRFIDIRNMAYMHYKFPDPQSPGNERTLLTYQESLAMLRPEVKRLVLQFEVQNNLIVPDGTEAAYFNAQPAAPNAVPEGAPQMATQAPPYQQMPIPGTQPQAAPPQPGYPPPPPPPSGYTPPPPPQFAPPPPPGAVPGVAPQQYAAPAAPPEAPAPRGRKRAAAGSAVAPPPPAPPPAPPQGYTQPPTQQATPPQPGYPPSPNQYAPPPPPAPGYAPPLAPTQQWSPPPPPQAVQAPPQAAPPQSIAYDFSAIAKTLDGIGGGLAGTSKDVESIKASVAELKTLLLCNLMATQHLWTQNQAISDWAKKCGFDTGGNVLAFRDWLASTLTPR